MLSRVEKDWKLLRFTYGDHRERFENRASAITSGAMTRTHSTTQK
jgi:hypothetical protein